MNDLDRKSNEGPLIQIRMKDLLSIFISQKAKVFLTEAVYFRNMIIKGCGYKGGYFCDIIFYHCE
jgi:hypothetical protein